MENKNEMIVDKVEGSVLTDNMILTLNSKIDDIKALAANNGELKGRIDSLVNDIHALEAKAFEAEKEVKVVIRKESGINDTTLEYDPYSSMWSLRKNKTYIDSIRSIHMDGLAELVNNAVRDEADQLVKEADREIEKANKKVETAEKIKKQAYASIAESEKTIDKKIQKAVDHSQKINLDIISKLEKDIKIKDEQLKLNSSDFELLKLEKDLETESLNHEIENLNRKIRKLIKTKKTIAGQLISNFKNYPWWRKLISNFH